MQSYKSIYLEQKVWKNNRCKGHAGIKPFLVREAFADKMDFYATGVNQENKKVQLEYFYHALCRCSDTLLAMPKNWLEAFASLITILESSKSDKKVVFLDELSWMNGGDGSFLTALKWFWNSWASARKDILLICCSSATSWIVNKVFHNHGGLYGRVNRRIHLHPFTLQECELLTKTRKSCQLVMITTYGLQNNQFRRV